MKRSTVVLLGFWAIWLLLAYIINFSESGRLAEALNNKDNFGMALIFLVVFFIFLTIGTLDYASQNTEEQSLPDDNSDSTWKVTTRDVPETEEKPSNDQG